MIKGSLADVRYLVDKGADANDKNDGDRTVLMDAVTRNDPEWYVFIERGADVKIRTTENNCCVLGEAARWANAEIVQLLIEHGADVNNVDTMGMTPLLYAATHDNVEAAQMLIENGANLEARERYKGFTPLLYACHLLKPKIIPLLVEKGADLNAKTRKARPHWGMPAKRRA